MEEQGSNKRNQRFTRNKTEDISNLLYGKIPPQARELEEAVLGAILIEKDAIDQVANILKPESFYVDAHATIYAAIQNLCSKNNPIDLLSVTEQLRSVGKLEETGGAYYLSELTNKIASSSNIENHARIVIQKFIQRELIRICNDVIRDSYEDTTDVFDLLDEADVKLINIKSAIYGSSVSSSLSVVTNIKKDLLLPLEIPLSVPSILDIRFDLGTVNAIGAKPRTGKTAVMIQACVNAAKDGYPAGIISLELNKRMLGAKIMHHCTGVFAKKILRHEISTEDKLAIYNSDYSSLQYVHIDDSRCTSENLRAKIIAMVRKHGVRIVWIDYIQLVTLVRDKGITDVKAMELLMTVLQQLSKELNIAIVVLSQLTRGWEKPNLEELRGGGIEQACTQVYLLWDEFAKENQGKQFLEIDRGIRGRLIILDEKERFDDVHNRVAYYDKLKQVILDWNDRDISSPEFRNSFVQQENVREDRAGLKNNESFDIF